MQRYQLIMMNEWKKLEQAAHLSNNSPYSFVQDFGTLLSTLTDGALNRVKHFYTDDYLPVINYCIDKPKNCVNLYSVLERVGLRHSSWHHKQPDKVRKAFYQALRTDQIVILRLPPIVGYHVIPSSFPVYAKKEFGQEIPAYYAEEQIALIEEEKKPLKPNWIDIEAPDLPGQDVTIFDPKTGKILATGQLDDKGFAHIKLPSGFWFVDIVLEKQDTRSFWYYDIPVQVLGGVRDATQEALEIGLDFTKEKMKSDIREQFDNANLFTFFMFNDFWKSGTIGAEKNIDNIEIPVLPEVSQPQTAAGAITRGVSQFMTGFFPVFRTLKFIKPVGWVGKTMKGVTMGAMVDATVFDPQEARLANLIEQYPELSNPITRYLKTKPDDSGAEGRFKNALEGAMLGTLIEPLFQTIKAFKFIRIKPLYQNIRTRTCYKFKVEAVEVKTGNIVQVLNYKPTSGVVLKTTPDKTTTVLGTYKDDTEAILRELDLPKSTDFGPRDGGFNLLNTPNELYDTPAQFWKEYNKPWLDNAIKRNDIIVLATNPTESVLYRTNELTNMKELTGFGKEYLYLTKQHGYKLDVNTMQLIVGK